MIHLSEAVASRRTGKYSKLNQEIWNTKDGIIDYLEKNGYKFVDEENHWDIAHASNSLGGEMVYAIGKYNREDISHWIKFYDPSRLDGYVMFCRERDVAERMHGDMNAAIYAKISLDSGLWENFDDFDEFIKFINKNLDI